MYVILNANTGKYVAPPGEKHSYTAQLQHARTFNTLADAQRDCCGNERVLTIAQAMHQTDDK